MAKLNTYASREELAAAMERITRREVKHYRSDFTDYDRPAILDPEKISIGGPGYYWITRECGTYLFPCDAWEFLSSVLEHYGTGSLNIRHILIGPAGIQMLKVTDDGAQIVKRSKIAAETWAEIRRREAIA